MRAIWLVNRGAGYPGVRLVHAMRRVGYRVVVVDCLSTGSAEVVGPDVGPVRGSVTDIGILQRVLRDHRVDGVMQLAGRKAVPESMIDPRSCLRENADGMLALVEGMEDGGASYLVLASSAAVYGESAHGRVEEDAPSGPLKPYGETKVACEWIARDAHARGLRAVSLRYFKVAGTADTALRDRTRGGLVPLVVDAVAAVGRPRVFGHDHMASDGSCVRDYVHVEDVARAHVLVPDALLAGRWGETYNLGSGRGSSVLDVLAAVTESAGTEVCPEFATARAGDPLDVGAAIDRNRADFGWRPTHDLASVVASEWAAAPSVTGGIVVPLGARQRPSRRRDRVVLVSASVGAGHDGAAKEWAARLESAGYRVEIHDFLDLIPVKIGAGMNRAYELILCWAPWAYELIYRAFERRSGADSLSRALLGRFRGRLADLVDDDTVAVLSTYPLASQMLGQLRRRGTLTIPTATFLTDSSVHRLWVSRDVDAHFALHSVAADQAARIGGRNVVVSGPLVPGRFRPGGEEERRASRAAFGLPADGRLALLVAGSWGVGDVEKTALDILQTGSATPVIVCGRNETLREQLTHLGTGRSLGWVSDMPTLLHAVDVLVENAGGLSSLEAMAAEVPVLSYRPIPGHGRTNAAALQAAGVSRYVTRTRDLGPALRELLETTAGTDQVTRARELFDAEPVTAFERLVTGAATDISTAGDELAARRMRRGRRRVRATSGIVAALMMVLLGTEGTDIAVAHGFGAVRVGKGTDSYLIVHPDPTTPLNAIAITRLRETGASVAVDSAFLRARPDEVTALSAAGVPIINAAGGPPYRTGLIHGRGTIRATARGITGLAQRRPALYLSGRELDAADVSMVVALHERVVQPSVTLTAVQSAHELHAGQITLLECSSPSTACDLPTLLAEFERQAEASDFTLRSVESLRR